MARTFTGTLIGPHGERVGQYVSFEDYHNETQQLREVLGVLARLEERAFRTRDELAAGVRRVAGDALEPV